MSRIKFGKYRAVNKTYGTPVNDLQYAQLPATDRVIRPDGKKIKLFHLTHEISIEDNSEASFGSAFLLWANSKIIPASFGKQIVLRTPSLVTDKILDLSCIYTFDIGTLNLLDEKAKSKITGDYNVRKGSERFYADAKILIDRSDPIITKVYSAEKLEIPEYTELDKAWEMELASILRNTAGLKVMAFDNNSMYFSSRLQSDLINFLTIRKAIFCNALPYPTASDALVFRSLNYRVPDNTPINVDNGGYGDCSFRSLYAILSRMDGESIYDCGLFCKTTTQESSDAEAFGKIIIALYVIGVFCTRIADQDENNMNVFADLPAYFIDIMRFWMIVGSYPQAVFQLLGRRNRLNSIIGAWTGSVRVPISQEAEWAKYDGKNYLAFIYNTDSIHYTAQFVGEEGNKKLPNRRQPQSRSDFSNALRNLETAELVNGYFAYLGCTITIQTQVSSLDADLYEYTLTYEYDAKNDRRNKQNPADAHWAHIDENVLYDWVLNDSFIPRPPKAKKVVNFSLDQSRGIDDGNPTGFENALNGKKVGLGFN
jgi:hypothetical protein